MLSTKNGFALLMLIATTAAAGCGSSSGHSSTSAAGSATSHTTAAGPSGAAGSGGAPGALSGEAASAASGDIPDNQTFLVFHNQSAGYSIKYPEGWTQGGSANDIRFTDKNNVVRIFIARAAAPTPASVTAQLDALRKQTPSLTFTAPRTIAIGGATAVKTTYTTKSPPNPVTGKRVTLVVDRYELGHTGRIAIVDLGTPVGVDNVDAYRMMIQSFAWR